MKIAGIQMDVAIGAPELNLDRIAAWLQHTTREGARLTIFPECAVTGYCFDSFEESLPWAEPIPGPMTDRLTRICRDLGTSLVTGMLERDGSRIFNAAVLIGPDGVIGNYRKVHLPYLGVDMHTTPGDRPFAVYEVDGVRIGMNICYDAGFPEAARCLALLGADLIVLPTNWPPGAECLAAATIPSRALENSVYYAAINRVGTERGFRFIGRSSICAPDGSVLVASQGVDEEVLYAEIDPARARAKRIIRVPDKHEIDRLADRRPEMYGLLTDPHQLATPRQLHQRPS